MGVQGIQSNRRAAKSNGVASMAEDNDGEIYASLAGQRRSDTIVMCKVTGEGAELLEQLRRAERKVEAAVKKLLRSCDGGKWVDPDFGPTDEDEFGTKSIYRDGKVRWGGAATVASLIRSAARALRRPFAGAARRQVPRSVQVAVAAPALRG